MAKQDGHVKQAVFLAAVCGQTYDQLSNTDGAIVIPPNYTLRHTILAKSFGGKRERFGFIIESPQDIIIAFRGTTSRNDWISDIMAAQVRFKYVKKACFTHRGFTGIYTSARKELLSALAKLQPDKRLLLTGHSLGAALATLCAADLAANTPQRPMELYTYGSPRVGDPAFVKAVAQSVHNSCRYANPFDMVTHTPPTVLTLPIREKTYYYSHVQTLESTPFQYGSIEANHIISSYFGKLSQQAPIYTEKLCAGNPGFCPLPADP